MKKAIIYVCLCSKVQKFDEWIPLTTTLMQGIWEKVKKEKYELVVIHSRKCPECSK